MDRDSTNQLARSRMQELLGYLNFSSGNVDKRFLANLNWLYAEIEAQAPGGRTAEIVRERLIAGLAKLNRESAAFHDVEQARAVIQLVFAHFLPGYLEFHRDLLWRQTGADLWRPFFVGRACEAVLREGGPWSETERIVAGALARFNDYVGHRPVAVLHSGQRLEPYRHEWTRPVPLYIQDAGVAAGRYAALVGAALDLLRSTPPRLLSDAHFDLNQLDELALDMRGYEFDHPANKRPVHHFGQWDPNLIDNRGAYRRFVLQQVTLDALLARVEEPSELPADERLFEAAAVLAGVMLMSSAVSGGGPGTHDSSVTLATLLPRVAADRDAFYEQLLAGLSGGRGERLRAEAKAGRQPFAAARQHLNHTLARRRATQLERIHLSLLYARMGQRGAALDQAQAVPVASARMRAEIQCRLTGGGLAARQGRLADAARALVEAEDFLHRAIQCGALVDPWNILGFQGNFSLFPAPENSVHDHRIPQLIELVEQLFDLHTLVWSAAAAQGEAPIVDATSSAMRSLAAWWDPFATTTVGGVESFSGAEAVESAQQVALALGDWRRGGASVGDIGFWRKHVGEFQSPKAYGLVVEALLDKGDLVAARALLIQWSSRSGEAPLKFGPYSFHDLARQWLDAAIERDRNPPSASSPGAPAPAAPTIALASGFFDHLEANAGDFWAAPTLGLAPAKILKDELDDLLEDDSLDDDSREDGAAEPDGEGGLYRAAYDEMVYVDSAADGVEGDMLETPGLESDFELEHESRRLEERLAFLSTIATLWKRMAAAVAGQASGAEPAARVPTEALDRWRRQAMRFEAGLLELLESVEGVSIPVPSAARESLMEFEHRRAIKEALLENVIGAASLMAVGRRWLMAAGGEAGGRAPAGTAALRALLASDATAARRLWPELLDELRKDPLLYVPLHKGGKPGAVLTARLAQQRVRDLLTLAPRLGLIRETCQLIEAAREMENDHPAGANAITEFDRIFSVAYRALVESLADVSRSWSQDDQESRADRELIDCLERLTESLLKQWLAHSRTLRLSTLERIGSERDWNALVAFIERYGREIFTQRFMNSRNLRAILRQGPETWLARLAVDRPDDEATLLLDDLEQGALSRPDAARQLSIVLEAVAENFVEYRDYNSTTTQSDHGELVYMFLDFLRLRVQYDRVAWHLRPVLLAHEILVRKRREGAAELWRRALAERTGEVADTLETRYRELCARHGMRLPTVADRLAERFVRPLAVDRLRALVRPAMEESLAGEPSVAFEVLRQEADELTREPTGAGLDVPPWLVALEDEVEEAGQRARRDRPLTVAQRPLTLDDVLAEIEAWESLAE